MTPAIPTFAEARVLTDQGPRHLSELCQALEERAAGKPERAVSIEWSETNGTIDFGWGCCAIHADATHLTLRAQAEDESALRQVCELITRHLERHPGEEKLTVIWRRDGEPIRVNKSERRDAMRAFHRRMRNH